jgi:hypothetical protein
MQQNRFLQEFINMRKSLNQSPQLPTIHQASQDAYNKGNAGTTSLVSNKKQAPAPTPPPVMSDDITYKKIIEDKPPKADVLEYFRSRIEELKADQ